MFMLYEIWRYSEGMIVQAHGGEFLRISDDYYWLGKNKGSASYMRGEDVKSNSCQPTFQQYIHTRET